MGESATPNPDYDSASASAGPAGASGPRLPPALSSGSRNPWPIHILSISAGQGLGDAGGVAVSADRVGTLAHRRIRFIGRLQPGSSGTRPTHGPISRHGLLLTGVVVNAFLSAVILFLASSREVNSSTRPYLAHGQHDGGGVSFSGSAEAVSSQASSPSHPQPQLNVISVGTTTRSIGVPVERIVGRAIAAFITAVAVNLSGLIGSRTHRPEVGSSSG
jgi:hypothetical protein